ncbi:sickle tail protein homolog isoform X3 [Dicentrarchus labrax]|uniref:sickle tail protein homolog isoform X3 n=1 Tax=Dicentrarchus labrax TaxID=13489 RepID=UPI0021F5A33D|nr:sickle tail protein homolog isoform X3 [Dicentrarchus labrax]
MSKSSSRLGRPGSAGSKSQGSRKELQGNRSCMLRIGERLMRAGSEGNLVQRPLPVQSQSQAELNGQTHRPALEDKPTEHTGNNSSKAPRSPSTLPRTYATATAAASRDSQLDSLMMQHTDVERKKEVFLDHLRQKYPHHAAIIMGHQDRMRKQVGSPRPSESPTCAGVLGLVEQQDPLATEAMSDGEVLPPTAPFTRGCKARASLPVGRSSGQTRERPLGVLYLQYGEETKQARIPTEISSQDSLRALFVTAFPHQLTMKMLQSPSMAIYIKDNSRNVYYDLEDIRNITSHSCLKVYHKDPAHVFNRHARPVNAEGRISKEVLYGSHSPVHTLSSSSRGTLHSLQGSMSPPMVRSMPSSPSRMVYGGGSKGVGAGPVDPGSATLPRERLSGAGRSSTLYTNSSAILERRDVKPDEDAASSKSMPLVLRGEGGPHYPDSYCSYLQDGGGRLSIASSQCSAPPSLAADMVDAGVTGIPGGLQQYRVSIKPLMGYGESMDHQTRSLHRPKSRKYGDSQRPPLGTKTPPPSPHRVNEVKMIDGQIIGGVGLVSPERMSPIRRSLQRDSNGATVDIVNRSGSSSSTSSVFVDSPLGQPERLFQGPVTASNTQSERMKAMEEQIASLAGLVHHALSMGSDVPGVKDTVSEPAGRKLFNNRPGVSTDAQNPAALTDQFIPTPLALQAPPSDSGMQQSLMLAKKSVCELRLQLNQLRHLQLSNQESVSSMLRMAGQELVVLICDCLAQSEEVAYRRRTEMEEERIHYLATEERILSQLNELENYVDRLQRSSASSPGRLSITLRDVEEGAVNLRRVGEAVAILKGEFPELQVKMRSVLRLEVEAVRFLKEEPHKMDSMLKRVKTLTEALSSLRRCVSESTPPARSAQVEPLKVLERDQGPVKTQSPLSSPKPQPRSSVRPTLPTPSLSENQTEVSLAGSASPIMSRRMKSTAATVIQPSHCHPSPPLTPTHGRDSPSVAKVSPCSREGSPALQKRPGPLQSERLGSSAGTTDQPAQTSTQESHTDQTTMKDTQTITQTTERQIPEGSLSVEPSCMTYSSTSQANLPDSIQPLLSNSNTDFDQALQEAQDSLMKSIPDLNVSETRECPSDSSSGQIPFTASKSEQDTPLDLTLQVSVEQQIPLSNTQEDTPDSLRDEMDFTQLKLADTAPAAPLQLPAATGEPPPSAAPSPPPPAVPSPPPSASPSTERSSRPQVEKPRRSSVDKEMKQSPDRSGKSPPPPPPRRFHAVSSGLTTGRSGEVISTSRKEPVGAQNDDEKEKVVVPQPKPPRQPPEVKPKPQMFLAGSSPTPATARAHRDEEEEEEEEEEEDNKFMKELQVFQKCTMRDLGSVVKPSDSELQSREREPKVTTQLSNKTNLPGGNKQWKRKLKTSPKSQVANQNPSELATSAYQSAPQPRIIDGCPRKLIIAAGLEEHSEAGKGSVSLDKIENVVKHVPSLNSATIEKVHPPEALQDIQKNEEVPTPTQKKAEKTEVLTVTTSQKENDITVNTHEQINKEVVGHVCSPTSAEKKVKFTTIVTLQKENMPASPVQTNESIKEVPAEKKSDVMVVLTLQKENTPEDCLIELSPKFQQDKYLCSDQECVASFQLQQLPPISPILTYSHRSKQQNQESTVQVSRDRSRYAEEGGSLNPEIWDDEGPPPSPPKISLRISKTRVRTHSQEEDLTKIIGSDIQNVTGDSTGEPTYWEYENQGFEDSNDSDMRPILVILNELDIQSAYKRLSTIFECEEDLDGLLSPENIVDEEQTKQEQKQDVRNICINSDITGNGLSSPHLQHQKPSEDNGSIPKKKEDQDKPDSPRKAETKRKFKFKFPKNKLAAISQAIRTGTTKTGKNTLEVVVYEEEEEKAPDSRPLKETKKQTKKFEISSTKQMNSGEGNACDRDIKVSSPIDTRHSHSRVEELCKSAFDSIDNLEESIKQLEISVDSITAPSSPSSIVSSPPQSPDSSFDSTDRAQHKVKVKQERERSLSKRPATQILKGPNPPQSKRAKPQPPHDKGKTSTKKQTSSSSSSSSVQRSHTKSHHSPSSCSPEKTPKGHQQAIQMQPSQPHLVAIPR